MLRYWAGEAAASAPTDWIATILQWGPPGVVIVLLLTGVVVTKGNHDDVKSERDRWRAAYEKECDAHDETREALAEAARSATAAIETARTTTGLLSHLGHPSGRPGS
jgi:hypothetical protein